MDAEFWNRRWAEGRIGFHHTAPNPYLLEHWPGLGLPAGARVLVPLCGKSVDLGWLAEQGYAPVGIEIARQACEAVFTERGVAPECERHGSLECFRGDGIEVWCGDFFRFGTDRLASFDALWDRAALIALPAEERPAYVEHCARLLRPRAPGIVVTLAYDPAEMEGPPFPVTGDEVERLYAPWFELETATPEHPGPIGDHLRERGLTHMTEAAWRVTRREDT